MFQAAVAIVLALSSGLAALASVELPDQLGGHDSLDAHRGKAVVVIVADARRLATAGKWARELVTRFPGLKVMTIADVSEGRPTTVGQVAEVLGRRVPGDVPVLIDIDRRWSRELALDTRAPNLLVIDAGGALAGQFRGRWSKSLGDEVADAIERLGTAS